MLGSTTAVGQYTVVCLKSSLTRAQVDVLSKAYMVSRYSVSVVVIEE